MDFDGFDDFDFDTDLEAKTGIEIEIAPARLEGDVEVAPARYLTILRDGGANRHYFAVLNRLRQPYAMLQLAGKPIPDDDWIDILREAYAEAIVIGWRNMTIKGEPIPFSKENVIEFFKRLPNRFDAVVAAANTAANFKRKALDAAAKN